MIARDAPMTPPRTVSFKRLMRALVRKICSFSSLTFFSSDRSRTVYAPESPAAPPLAAPAGAEAPAGAGAASPAGAAAPADAAAPDGKAGGLAALSAPPPAPGILTTAALAITPHTLGGPRD